jgi:hypothetical protein
MSNPEYFYEIEESVTESGIQYSFMSEGKTDIIKVIEYSYVQDFMNKPLYNLGFGDYDAENDKIFDSSVSNNGDHYKVFNTVLNTIPSFFDHYQNAVMIVQGSDSKSDFLNKCKITCKKKCPAGECKNSHRRINVYRSYVDKNYDTLIEDYTFYGGEINADNQMIIESYQKGKKYDSVLLLKKEV